MQPKKKNGKFRKIQHPSFGHIFNCFGGNYAVVSTKRSFCTTLLAAAIKTFHIKSIAQKEYLCWQLCKTPRGKMQSIQLHRIHGESFYDSASASVVLAVHYGCNKNKNGSKHQNGHFWSWLLFRLHSLSEWNGKN